MRGVSYRLPAIFCPRTWNFSKLFPEADVWGAIISSSHPLAKKKSIHVSDLIGEPLFVSEQSWNNEIKVWAKDRYPELKLEGSFRLSYNGSVFARENLGILLTL